MSFTFTIDFHPASNYSFTTKALQCFDSTLGRYILTAFSFTYALCVLPLSILVLYVGFQRWRQNRSAIRTHADFFTYNIAVIELVALFGYAFYYCSSYADLPVILTVGNIIMFFTWPGQILFPILICVERYLAAVHPIIYRGLRKAGGVKIRNISTGCIWLSCFVWACFAMLLNNQFYYRRSISTLILIVSLIIMVFCSISVLRVLIRPGPGKVGRDRMQVGQSKQKAFHNVLIIMAVLWLRFWGNAIIGAIRFSTLETVKCVGEVFTFVFFLPCILVLSLLFLQREGKLQNCKHSTGSG